MRFGAFIMQKLIFDDMRNNKRLAIATMGILCLMTSCSWNNQIWVPNDLWVGKFTIQMPVGTGDKVEDRDATIEVYFSDDKKVGVVTMSLDGMFAGNRTYYDVKWEDESTFGFYGYPRAVGHDEEPKVRQYFDGTISGDQMTLRAHTQEGEIGTVYQLTRKKKE